MEKECVAKEQVEKQRHDVEEGGKYSSHHIGEQELSE